jgi:hypothetical protein
LRISGVGREADARLQKIGVHADGAPAQQRVVPADAGVIEAQAVAGRMGGEGCAAEAVEILLLRLPARREERDGCLGVEQRRLIGKAAAISSVTRGVPGTGL